MTLLEFIRHFLELLATRLYWTSRNSGHYFALLLGSLITIRFIFQRKKLFKLKLRHILKRGLQYGSSFIRKEKSEPNFNILKSVFMDGISYSYREWANPVAYFCTESSSTGGNDVDKSESDTEEESSQDEHVESFENGSKEEEIKFDSKTFICISSTKSVFQKIPASQITHKRKAESNKSECFKRSKSADSLNVGEASNPTQETDVNIKISSEMSSNYRKENTSTIQLSDHQLISDESSASDLSDTELSKTTKDNLYIEKSKSSEVTSPLKDIKPDIEDFSSINSEDKNEKSGVKEMFSSHKVGGALKNTVQLSEAKPSAAQAETTKKSYPVPKKGWENKVQDEFCKTPSDPRIRENYTSESESRLGSSRSLQENSKLSVMQDNAPTQQSMVLNSNPESTDAGNILKDSANSSLNVLECPPIFPEINYSAILREQPEQLTSSESFDCDETENVPEIIRQFFQRVRDENILALANINVPLECSVFSSESEVNLESSGLKPMSVQSSVEASGILPCSSIGEPKPSMENVEEEQSKDISKFKIYPGLSLQPLKVKKDARYQKKFYKERKEVTLPKKLGEVIQWAAKKSRDEVTVPASDTLSSDETNLPIVEYHKKAQELSQTFMTIYDRAKEEKAKKKLEKKNRKEQKKRKKENTNTGYIESSFKEESPSESSSDSLPTSGDSPVKASTSPVSRPKVSPDYDISMVEVSPLKPDSKVPPRFLSQPENLCQGQPGPLNIRHLSDEENVLDSIIFHKYSSLFVVINFIDKKEIINPKNAIFCRDMLCLDASQEKQRLKAFYRIQSVTPVSCSPVSVEEFLDDMRKTQDIYYQMLYNEDKSAFKFYQTDMSICVIPLHRAPTPDGDYELDGETLVKTEYHPEPEQNFSPFTPDLDYLMDVNISEREKFGTDSQSPNKANRDQIISKQVTMQASNTHQSHRGDLSASSSCNDWTLHEIEFGGNKSPRKHSEEGFSQNIQTKEVRSRIESKMEEWPSDVYQSDETSAAKNVDKKRPGLKSTTGSAQDTLPVLFGFPSPDVISRMMAKAPQWECKASKPIRRKTKSESSKYERDNVIVIEPKKPPKEVQTDKNVSTECREKSVGRRYETENRTRTEINFEYTYISKDLEPNFNSNPVIVASRCQESPGGLIVTAEETINKELNRSPSEVEENTESIQQAYDIDNELKSAPEKDILPETDELDSSRDQE